MNNKQSAKNRIKELATQLVEFGLNPKDWKILPVGSDRYKVQYTDDATWYFLGTTKHENMQTKWSQMQLASI